MDGASGSEITACRQALEEVLQDVRDLQKQEDVYVRSLPYGSSADVRDALIQAGYAIDEAIRHLRQVRR